MDRVKDLVRKRDFWIVAVMMVICTFFHYFSPQIQTRPLDLLPLTRQAVVRIIFLLPVSAAAFAFERRGGLIALGLATLIMLPRVVFLSQYPIDAFFETTGIVVVGGIVVWIIDTQEREKRLRQRAVEELSTVNSIALTLTRPYELEAMLDEVLTKVLEAVGSLATRGAVFLLDPWGQTLHLRAHKGLSHEFVEQATQVPFAECLCGLTATSGKVTVVRDALSHPQHKRCPVHEPHAHVCVPLASKDQLLGILDVHLDTERPMDAIDEQMFAAIGRQIGVAVENARLCENLRFYVRQIADAQEDERKRIARDLHDETAQGLIEIARCVDDLGGGEHGLPKSVAERLDQLHQQIDDLLRGVRRFSRDLRPSILDDLGLFPAVESLMEDLGQNGIEIELHVSGSPRRLTPEVELTLYRIFQEALNNVKRHAQASQVVAAIEFEDDRIIVAVCDDGRGFEMPARINDLAVLGQFGFVGMLERVRLLRGIITIQSEVDRGTTVMVEMPVDQSAET
jgi:signal transduction histidine kinase